MTMVRRSLLLALWLLSLDPVLARDDGALPVSLAPGAKLSFEIDAGKTHRFDLVAEATEYLELQAFQSGADVGLVLLDPAGRQVQAVDDQRARDPDPESLHWITERAGRHRLEVRNVGDRRGTYRLHWIEHGQASAEHRLLVPAARNYARARGLQQRDDRGDWLEAIDLYRQILAVWRRLDEPAYEASTLDNLGVCHLRLEDLAAAESHFARAVELWPAPRFQVAKAKSLHNLAATRSRLGAHRQARAAFEAALRLLDADPGQELQAAKTRLALADAHKTAGRLAEAEAQARAALEVFERRTQQGPEDPRRDRDLRLALNTLGSIYSHLGEVEQAFAVLERARELADSDDRLGLRASAAVAANLASLRDWIGEPMLAIADLRHALELNRRAADRGGEAAVARQLGVLYRDVAQFDQALEHLEASAQLEQELGRHTAAAEVRALIGDVHRRAGRPARALEILEEALPRLSDHGNPTVRLGAFEKLGLALVAAGRLAEAREVYGRGLARLDRVEEPSRRARFLAAAGDAEMRGGSLDTAHRLLAHALELARTCRDYDPEVAALVGLARVERRRGRLPAAQDRLDEALDVIEKQRWRAGGERFRASFLAQQLAAFELAVDLRLERHRRRPTAGFDRQAFELSERMRARALHDLISRSSRDLSSEDLSSGGPSRVAEGGVVAELVHEERALRRRINALEHRLRTHVGASADEERARLDRALTDLVRRYREVQGRIFTHDPRLESLAGPRITSLREVQEHLLDADTVLLEVLLGEARSWMWLVTPETHRLVELPPRAEIEALAEQIRRELTSPLDRPDHETAEQRRHWPRRVRASEARYVEAGERLSHLLLDPVADLARGRRLVVVLDGALRLLPFGALPLPGSTTKQWQPILARHEVVRVPSASVLATLRDRRRNRATADRLLAIFADPVFRPEDRRVARPGTRGAAERSLESAARGSDRPYLRRLPYTRDEAEAIVALAEGRGEVMAALGLEATRERVLAADLAGFRYLHFATHGLLDDRRPELSAIVLSTVDAAGWDRRGRLHLHDIYDLRLSADLVTLSACDTAVGRQVRGEGLMSLTRGFFHAGVPSVLASLWRVDDRTTGELMQRFYTALLADGEAPVSALRRAVLEVRRASERHGRHPYFWAGFVLVGDWR